MGVVSAIEWTGATYNPWRGCDKVSPGCAHCYAAQQAPRLKGYGNPRYQVDGDPKTSAPGFGFTVHWDKLERPERFPAGARVFVNSMSETCSMTRPTTARSRSFGTRSLRSLT